MPAKYLMSGLACIQDTLIPDTAEALRQQYNSVFSKPRPEWTVTDAAGHFSCTGEEGETILDDFVFTPDDIEQACSELKNSASAGPD